MDKLNKNKFLTFMGVLFVVAVVGFFVLVFPAWGASGDLTTKINKSVEGINKDLPGMPGDPNVNEWTEYAATLKKRYGVSLQKLSERDRNLDQWFADVDNDSTYQFFMNRYDDEAKKLQTEMLDKGVLIGSPKVDEKDTIETNAPGFNWVQRNEILTRSNDEERQVKEILQKRYNIARAIANAVGTGVDKNDKNQRPRRLLDVTFLEKFKFGPPGAGPSTADVKNQGIAIDYRRYAGFVGLGSGSFSEWALPKNGFGRPAADDAPEIKELDLGKTLTFGFSVVMDYPQVPELVRSLISGDMEPVLNLAIVGLNIFVAEPNAAEKKEIYHRKPGETNEQIQKIFDEKTQASTPPQVHVYVTCQVYDLDLAAIPPFLKP